jgi:hypothetical protein
MGYGALSRTSPYDGNGELWIQVIVCSLTRGPTAIRARKSMIGANITSSLLQALEELDHRGIDLAGPLLLGPVTAAGEHERLAQLGDEPRQV